MSYGNNPLWTPRQTTYKTATAGTETVFTAAESPVDISNFLVAVSGAATVTLRGVSTGTTVAVLVFSAAGTRILPGWKVNSQGLEVDVSANTVHVTAFHGPIGASTTIAANV